MKFFKLFIVCAASFICLAVGFISLFSVSKTNADTVSEQTVSSLIQSSDVISSETLISQSQSEVQSDTSQSSESSQTDSKTALPDVNIPSADLSNESIPWGPGTSYNDKNQPTACVSLQEKYGSLGGIFLNSDDKIYLTFDLGYESGYTESILDTLKECNAKAVFFLTGSYAKNNKEIVQRIIDEGHTVGNHSLTHPDMTTVSKEEAVNEIMQVHQIILENYDYSSYLFRFPSGAFSESTLATAYENGYYSVFWSFAYNDWDNANQPDKQEALQKTVERLHPGAVYLLHPMETNSLILKDLIQTARSKGYEIGIM